MKAKQRVAIGLLMVVSLLFGLVGTAFAAPGAIWTTDVEGSVQINHFASRMDVYLNGGPQNGGPGLPDGDYWVRVTNPGGNIVYGVTDGATVQVSGGNMVTHYRLWDILFSDLSTTPVIQGFGNYSGVHKVWVSKVEGFTGSTNKTSNFTVGEEVPVVLGSLTVNKYGSSVSEPLVGATFELWLDGILQDTVEMLSASHTWTYLTAGTYIVKETVAPAGYMIRDPDQVQVTLVQTDNEVSSATVDFYNDPIPVTPGSITVNKYDQAQQGLAGATFALLRHDGVDWVPVGANVVMDSSSHTWPGLEAGTYRVVETAAPYGYSKATPDYEDVVLNQVGYAVDDKSVGFVNTLIDTTLGSITVNKWDDSQSPLSGATFALYRFDGEGWIPQGGEVLMLTPSHTWSNLEAGTYKVDEKSAPAGYVQPDPGDPVFEIVNLEEIEFVVESATVDFTNTLIETTLGSITVEKVDGSEAPLAGATFQLWLGDTMLNQVTMTSGTHTWLNLEAGDYTVVETAAPAGYLKDDPDSQDVTLTETDYVVSNETAYFMNTLIEVTLGSITVNKWDDSASPLSGATFALYRFDGEGWIPQGGEVLMLTPSHTWSNLEAGTYRVVEKSAPAGYLMPDPDFEVVNLEEIEFVVESATVDFTNTAIGVEPNPSVTIKKYVSVDNGNTWQDAQVAPGPTLWQGTNPVFRFVVTNTGNVDFDKIEVYDDVFGHIGDASPLSVNGEATWTSWDIPWTQGQHANTATVYAFCETPPGNTVMVYELALNGGDSVQLQPCAEDSDMAHYFGAIPSDDPTGTLTVRVIKTDDGNVAGLPVTITGALTATLPTNAAGMITVGGLFAGTYTADTSDVGYTSDGPGSVVLPTDASSGEIVITLTPPPPPPQLGAIEVTVVEEDTGDVLAGATVTITGPGEITYTGTSNAEGKFYVTDVTPGDYEALGELEGYDSDTDSATVVAGETAQMLLVLAQIIEIPPDPPAEPELPVTGANYLPNMAAGLGLLLAGLSVGRRRRR